MHGIQQGVMDAGREIGTFGGRVLEAGGNHLGAWDITWFVLGILLWAATMTALVVGTIALLRHLRTPKNGTGKDEKPAKEEKKEAKSK